MKSMSDEERQAQKLDRDWHDGKIKRPKPQPKPKERKDGN